MWSVHPEPPAGQSEPAGAHPNPPGRAIEGRVPVHLQLALTKEGAGELLGGKSVDWIERYVLPHVKTIRASRSVLIPYRELERWVSENSEMALGNGRRSA
jgi:hypothetical protein